MELTFGILLFCIVAFFVAGFIDSIAGGAGFVTAPSLLLVGMPPHMALGTGKLATSIGSLVALWTFWRGGLILMKIGSDRNTLIHDRSLARRLLQRCRSRARQWAK